MSNKVMLRMPGVIVAVDVPPEVLSQMKDGDLDVVSVKFRWTNGRRDELNLPCRDLTPEEVVTTVNRFLAERRIEFGFRPITQPAGGLTLIPGGGQ